jgi:hypothetical protein
LLKVETQFVTVGWATPLPTIPYTPQYPPTKTGGDVNNSSPINLLENLMLVVELKIGGQ